MQAILIFIPFAIIAISSFAYIHLQRKKVKAIVKEIRKRKILYKIDKHGNYIKVYDYREPNKYLDYVDSDLEN